MDEILKKKRKKKLKIIDTKIDKSKFMSGVYRSLVVFSFLFLISAMIANYATELELPIYVFIIIAGIALILIFGFLMQLLSVNKLYYRKHRIQRKL